MKGNARKRWQRAFKAWLKSLNYERCNDDYPGAVHSTELVDDFFEEYADQSVNKRQLEEYAEEIGWVSDYASEEDDEISDNYNE